MASNASRRDFLKWGLSGTAALALECALPRGSAFAEPFRHTSRTTGRTHLPVASTCRMCPAGCGIVAYLDGERLITLMGNPDHPGNRGNICAKGMAALNIHTHPERILKPLARKGARGEGDWEEVSWDSALARIAEAAQRAPDAGLLFDTVQTPVPEFARLLVDGADGRLIPRGLHEAWTERVLNRSLLGAEEVLPDVESADLILNFGANPFEGGATYIQLARRIVDARIEKGAFLTTFSCVNSNTAGRSDLWVPLAPGDFGRAALSICWALTEGDKDAEALRRRLGLDASSSPEAVEKDTGFAAETSRRLAEKIRSERRTVILIGEEVYEGPDPGDAARAIRQLERTIVERGFGPVPLAPSGRLDSVDDPVFVSPSELARGGELSYPEGRWLLVTHRSNPVYEAGPCPSLENDLRDEAAIALHVAVSPFLNETNAFADIVLPEAGPLESFDLFAVPAFDTGGLVCLQQPVTAPAGESRSNSDAIAQIGRALGLLEVPETREALLKRTAQRVPGFDPHDPALFEKGFARPRGVPGAPARAVLSAGPVATQGKSAALEEGEFHFLTFETNVAGADLAVCKWLSEIEHAAPVLIHPLAARRLRIADGDRVEVEAGGRTAKARVRITQGIHPSVAAMAQGQGHWNAGRIAAGKNFKSEDPDTGFLWWEKEPGRAVSAPGSCAEVDAETGGLLRAACRVRIRKA